MGAYKYLRKTFGGAQKASPFGSAEGSSFVPKEQRRQNVIRWNKEGSFVRLENPSRLDRAHAVGYRAKQGFVVVRARIGKGSSKREKPAGGRKPAHAGMTRVTPAKSLQRIAEERVSKKYPNMEALNSYYAGESGKHIWYEVIMVDPSHPVIKADRKINWIASQRGRAERGLTSAGKMGRK